MGACEKGTVHQVAIDDGVGEVAKSRKRTPAQATTEETLETPVEMLKNYHRDCGVHIHVHQMRELWSRDCAPALLLGAGG